MRPQRWALALGTYRRGHVLPRCLRLAAAQTRPPDEIVVVDASPDWRATREQVLDELAPHHPAIRWTYVEAERPSSAAQRNQAVRLADSDVIFSVDDDSLLYPDCAEEVMRVYDADARGAVAGVSAQAVDRPPPEPGDDRSDGAAADARPVYTATAGSPLRNRVRRWLNADDRFVPYDRDPPAHELPREIWHLHVTRTRFFPGFAMTWRREIALREPFDERMRRYAAGEDSDMSYRASRHGTLVKALDARLHHLGSGGGRLPVYVTTALGVLNPLMLHRTYSSDLRHSRRAHHALLRRRLLIELLKDLRTGEVSLPRTRGIWFGLRRVDRILGLPRAELETLYEALQSQLLDGDAACAGREPPADASPVASGNGMPNHGRSGD